ncbi:MAG: hypothetical protein ABR946_03940 [Solirubrobacteraceae bacterium]
MAGRTRRRLLSPTTATLLGVLSLLSIPASFVLTSLIHKFSTSSTGAVSVAGGLAFVLAFTAVGVIVARREPRNPMGWLLLALVLAVDMGDVAPAYAYLDYAFHRGTLPLGHLAVLLSASWEYAFVLLPLIILLFPDGRLGSRWRWPLRGFLVIAATLVAGTLSVAVSAFSLRRPVDGTGNLVGLNNPSGANAWFGPVQGLALLSCALLVLAALIHQTLRYRRASGEQRQQLKWLAAGGLFCIACFAINSATGGGSGLVGNLTFSVGLAALPVGMGVGILKYRLYAIDRLISRTLSYALLTALLVGTFIGLVALTTDTFALSGRVGVAASTLVAAALFNPLRLRIQRLVDRRFNRAHYDAEATVAAFTARLRDAVEIDAIRTDLLDAVNRAVQPTQASIWIKP